MAINTERPSSLTAVWEWKWPDRQFSILVGAECAKIFNAARQSWFQRERGGQLFVDVSDQQGIWLVASTPSPRDKSGHTWLEINAERSRVEIEKANAAGMRLVGYWHTHPQKIPIPSQRDIQSFRDFSLHNANMLPNPIIVIVGNGHSPDASRAWILGSSGSLHMAAKLMR